MRQNAKKRHHRLDEEGCSRHVFWDIAFPGVTILVDRVEIILRSCFVWMWGGSWTLTTFEAMRSVSMLSFFLSFGSLLMAFDCSSQIPVEVFAGKIVFILQEQVIYSIPNTIHDLSLHCRPAFISNFITLNNSSTDLAVLAVSCFLSMLVRMEEITLAYKRSINLFCRSSHQHHILLQHSFLEGQYEDRFILFHSAGTFFTQ